MAHYKIQILAPQKIIFLSFKTREKIILAPNFLWAKNCHYFPLCYLESEYLVRALSGGGEGDDEHVGGGNRLSPGPEAATESVSAASKVTERGTGAKGLLWRNVSKYGMELLLGIVTEDKGCEAADLVDVLRIEWEDLSAGLVLLVFVEFVKVFVLMESK